MVGEIRTLGCILKFATVHRLRPVLLIYCRGGTSVGWTRATILQKLRSAFAGGPRYPLNSEFVIQF